MTHKSTLIHVFGAHDIRQSEQEVEDDDWKLRCKQFNWLIPPLRLNSYAIIEVAALP